LIFCSTQRRAITWSFRPAFPGTSSFSKLRNPVRGGRGKKPYLCDVLAKMPVGYREDILHSQVLLVFGHALWSA
jgi:hypothetical protein